MISNEQQQQHAECLKSELDLFLKPPAQISHVDARWVENLPVVDPTQSGPIIFNIPGSDGSYTDLASSYLKLRFKIKNADGTDIAPDVECGPINLTLHSLFQQIDLYLNDKQISDGSATYPYRAYIESLLSYGHDAKHSQLQGSLFYKDTPKFMNSTKPAENDGLRIRSNYAKKGVDLFGKLHLDIFNQPRYLINAVNIHLKLIKAKPEFVLMWTNPNKQFTYEISECAFVTRKVQITDAIRLAHENVLVSRSNCLYPINRVQIGVHSLSSGIYQFEKDNLFHGIIPSRVTLGFTSAKAFNGTRDSNPYTFSDFNVSSIDFLINDKSVAPMSLNIADNKNGSAFVNLFQSTHMFGRNEGNSLTREEFDHGSTIFCFECSPDLGDVSTLYRKGNTKLSVKFSEPTPEVISLIILSETDQLIQIASNRSVMTDFSV